MFKFLLKPNWLAAHILVITLALSLSSLGLWQLNRLKQTKIYNQKVLTKMTLAPKSLAELDKEYDFRSNLTDLYYLTVRLKGHFDPKNEILLRGRSYSGQAGYSILTPFITNNYTIMVERGWVPIKYNNPPIKEAMPPEGEIEILGKIYPSQQIPSGWLANFAPKDPTGKLKIMAYANMQKISEQTGYDLLDFYIKLDQQIPKQTKDLPLALIPEKLDNDNHLSYALQWFSFVLIGLVGYALIIRKRALER